MRACKEMVMEAARRFSLLCRANPKIDPELDVGAAGQQADRDGNNHTWRTCRAADTKHMHALAWHESIRTDKLWTASSI